MKRELIERVQAELADMIGGEAGAAPLPPVDLTRPPPEQWGDLALNVAMRLAKPLRRPPLAIAEDLAGRLRRHDAVFAEIRVAPPGFINLRLTEATLERALVAMAGADDLLVGGEGAGTVLVDYSSVNVAKQMHVGHLRSTIIGDVIARVLAARGHRVIRQNHLGDWGLPMAMVVAKVAPLLAGGGEATLDLDRLEGVYRQAAAEAKQDPAFAEECHRLLVRLQQGEPALIEVWQAIKRITMRECYRIYDLLGVDLRPEHERGESFYRDRLAGAVAKIEAAGLLKTSAGARCVFLPEFKGKDGAPLPMIVQKSDGGYNYATFDLAAVDYRVAELGAERIIYVTDARQALHFAQVFAVARAAGLTRLPDGGEARCEHVPFGTVLGDDGKPLKTRSGDNVRLAELLAEAIERARRVVADKNPDLPSARQDEVARQVGIGAVKYADLSQNRNIDYVFSFDRMLAMTGNTAPYLQYAHARICSIFRKSEAARLAAHPAAPTDRDPAAAGFRLGEPAERALALQLLELPAVVAAVAADLRPHVLCNYLYDLAVGFSTFYDQCPVLTAPPPVRDHRLALCALTRRTLAFGLQLLGLAAPSEM